MKKYLIPALVLLAALIGLVVFFVSMGYQKVQFANNISTHIAHVEEDGTLFAEYDGQKTQVVGQNIYYIKSSLTVYDRKKLYLKPDYDSETAVYLSFSDGAEIIVAIDDSVDDGVFVHYTYKGKNIWLSIKKFKTMHWIARAISPEGIYNKNIIVE